MTGNPVRPGVLTWSDGHSAPQSTRFSCNRSRDLVQREQRPNRFGCRPSPGTRARDDPYRHGGITVGAAEDLVGEAIAGHRDQVFLVSKVVPENASRTGTIPACEGSLARLRRPSRLLSLALAGRHPLEETVAAFEQLSGDGRSRSWGRGQLRRPDLEEIRPIAGPGPHRVQSGALPPRRTGHRARGGSRVRHCVAVVGYSPFGHGEFPEPAHPERPVLEGDRGGTMQRFGRS